jgi:hypothetical protein
MKACRCCWLAGTGLVYIAMFHCHRLMNIGHGGVPLLSVLVEMELLPRPPPLLLFLLPLPLLRWLLFLLQLLLLPMSLPGGRGGAEGCGFDANDALLELRAVRAATRPEVSRWIYSKRRSS